MSLTAKTYEKTKTYDKNPKSILIIAAEESSCLYAQRIIERLQKERASIFFFGIGNQAMLDLGFEALGRSEDLAVVGIQEVLSHLKSIKNTFQLIVEKIKIQKPDVVLLIDYPGFNLRLAKKIFSYNIPVIYYISPQIWAWKEKRVYLIKKYISKMLVVLPFEVEFYARYGVKAKFVGHPLLTELNAKYFDKNYKTILKNKINLSQNDKILGLMPGSRKGEIKNHLKVQIKAAMMFQKRHPDYKIVLLTAPSFSEEFIKNSISSFSADIKIIKWNPFEMIMICDLILCASGTATLMVGLLEIPMIIMYKMNWLTYFLARILVKGTKYFGLVNIIMGGEIVPEKWQKEANEKTLSNLLHLYESDTNLKNEMLQNLRKLKNVLGNLNSIEEVINELKKYL